MAATVVAIRTPHKHAKLFLCTVRRISRSCPWGACCGSPAPPRDGNSLRVKPGASHSMAAKSVCYVCCYRRKCTCCPRRARNTLPAGVTTPVTTVPFMIRLTPEGHATTLTLASRRSAASPLALRVMTRERFTQPRRDEAALVCSRLVASFDPLGRLFHVLPSTTSLLPASLLSFVAHPVPIYQVDFGDK
jgi:hypothetical protein